LFALAKEIIKQDMAATETRARNPSTFRWRQVKNIRIYQIYLGFSAQQQNKEFTFQNVYKIRIL